jgi:hypothetical protein
VPTDNEMSSGRDGRRLDAGMVEALRAVAGPPPATEIDWWTLRRTIVGDASAFLEGHWRRRWWEYAAGWIRPALPVGVAVSITAMLVLGSVGNVTGAALSSVATVAAADTADGSLWLHAVGGGAAASDADPVLGESRIATALFVDAQASPK